MAIKETEGCKKCEEAKKAFMLLNRAGFINVSVMCNYCEAIWKLEDERIMLNKRGYTLNYTK